MNKSESKYYNTALLMNEALLLLLEKKDYEKTQLIANELISAGEPIYKLITDETWSLVIETDAENVIHSDD